MNFDDYKNSPGINASFLKACSFGAYQGWKYLHEPPYQSDAMAFGTAVHCALLEPELYAATYIQVPMNAPDKLLKPIEEYKKLTDDHIQRDAWWKNFEAANKGKIILPPDQASKIDRIKARCNQIEPVRIALETFEKEKTVIFGDGKFKARLDLVDMKNGVVIDVKTTRDASPREFANQMIKLRYQIQTLHYAKAVNANAVYVIAVESDTAEVCSLDVTDITFSNFTKRQYEKSLEVAFQVMEMKECPNKFPSDIVSLSLPKWALEDQDAG